MIVSVITAFDKNGAIGVNGNLPWSVKDDFDNYKKITKGHCLIMGRKTYESDSQPIPGRTNIILTTNKDYKAEDDGSYIRYSIEAALKLAFELGHKECFINGGAQIYKLGMPYVSKAYITEVNCQINDADSFFPNTCFDSWERVDGFHFSKDDRNEYSWDFNVYTRVSPKSFS
jgi:dihydrofolate reductase